MKKILLVEDDPATVDVYRSVFERAGFDIEILKSGREGLERLKKIDKGEKEKPDLVLLDLILPDVNGINILEKARKNKSLKNIPFFILTNYTDPSSEEKIWKLGVEKYIIKANYTPDQLIKLIKNWFNSHNLKEKAPR